jgi:hypothetical protein
MNKTIQESLNATFGVTEAPKEQTAAVVPATKTKTKAVTKTTGNGVESAKKLRADVKKEKNLEERDGDLKTSRNALETVLRVGTDAIDSLNILAVDSEEPRTYEVLAELIDKIGNAAEKLYKLRREEAEIARIEAKIEQDANKGKDEGPKSVTTNNTIFVGDAKELLKHIKGASNQTIDVKSEPVK